MEEVKGIWARGDLYRNGGGGSHSDGGAFIVAVQGDETGNTVLQCVDKFGRVIEPDPTRHPLNTHSTDGHSLVRHKAPLQSLLQQELTAKELFEQICQRMPAWDYDGVQAFLDVLEQTARNDDERARPIETLTLLIDRRHCI